jgi:hypothetical protein
MIPLDRLKEIPVRHGFTAATSGAGSPSLYLYILAHATRFGRVTGCLAQRPVQTLRLLSRGKSLKQFAATLHQYSSVAKK